MKDASISSAGAVRDLLELALPDDARLDPGRLSDPTSDLSRGRALRRRRRAMALGSVPAVAALTAVALVPVIAQRGPALGPAPSTSARSAAPRLATVALVAYEGSQPPGYQVAWAPDGWVVQGGDAFALTIARAGDPDTQPASFTGKLVVMLNSADAPPVDVSTLPPGYRKVEVHGRPGRVHVEQAAAQPSGATSAATSAATAAGTSAGDSCLTVTTGKVRGKTGEMKRLKVLSTDASASPRVVTRRKGCDPADLASPLPSGLGSSGAGSSGAGSSGAGSAEAGSAEAGSSGGGTQVLEYQLADGRWAVVQAPVTLGWDAAELVRFAEGVTVLSRAEAGRG